MVLGWRRRKNNNHKGVKQNVEVVVPNHFMCPISLDLMKDPVTLSTGITYDRENVEKWFDDGNCTCPVTDQIVRNLDMIPNHSLRIMIQDWCVENKQHGFERIPTPRIPISRFDVAELVIQVKASARGLDQYGCLELVYKLKSLCNEMERNKRCIVENGAQGALASAFDTFANDSIERNVSVLEEILSALNCMFPLKLEAHKSLGSKASLTCMVWFLKHQDFSGKEKSIVTLKELLSFGDEKHVEALSEIEGVCELLVEFINKRISPTITKASMRVVCTKQGREKGYSNYLTVPLLVKKILRVSALATDHSISSIWKMCKLGEKDDEKRVVVEALQVGAFQKILLVLQVGCGDEIKEKATELLKLMNPYRAELECIDSDYKNLKRSF
ncbi:unnamed protein product [Lupinus luteus]|uniref:U-box domain-containing protein n=1 Tax=Lupinus luteus TaxID=3873 RepID=A0AAV1XKH7_LUPLU